MTRSDAHRLAPGDVVDDFRIEAVLAEGGTTTTFRATSQALGRAVALKHFHAEGFVGDVGSVEDARRDASAVARLEHPGITPVYAAGEWGGGLYVASALASGPHLDERIAGDGLSPEETSRIITELAAAIEQAHSTGIIHRDLRPECITLGRWGHAQLGDFGVTRASGRTGLLTRAEVMASLRYTAPEIILGRHAVAATDTFGLAAIAVACLTGAPPYEDRAPAKYVMLRTSAPPPRLRNRADGAALGALSTVIAQGMALDPMVRPKPADFAASLAAVIDELPAGVRGVPAPLEAVEVEGDEVPAPAPAPEVEVPAPAAEPLLPPNAGDVTRVEQRRPVLQTAGASVAKIPWTTWASGIGLALTLGVLAALAGFLTAPGKPEALKIGAFRVVPPSGWRADAGGAPTLRASGGATATLAVAPARLPGNPLPTELVGRIAPVHARAGDRQVVVYDGGGEILVAAPTVKGTLYARCTAPTGTERCAALVVQDVTGPAPVPVVPDPRAADALRAAMAMVQQQGGVALGEMTAAKADDRANGATALAGTLRNAAGALTLDKIDPGTAAALGQTAKALAAEAGALEQLSSALDRKSAAALRAARSAATAADERLRTSLNGFAEAGYKVQG